MTLAMLVLSALLLTYAGFGLFQATGERQPLAKPLARLGRFARPLARVPALGSVTAGLILLGRTAGWAEASLLIAVDLVLVASVFVLLAPVVPRLAWGLAIAALPLAGALALGARWVP